MNYTSPKGVGGRPPVPPTGGLPLSHTPVCAAYAPGPFIDVKVVAPSEVRWANARTYVVRDRTTDEDYRALRVFDSSGNFVGYWAIELLSKPLYFGIEFEGNRQDDIEECEAKQVQDNRDKKRRRLRGSNGIF